MPDFTEEADTTLVVKGPAEVIIDGDAEVFGCSVRKVVVEEGKTLPIYLKESSTVNISDDAFFIPVRGSTIPESWDRLVESGKSSFFIYGSSDSGKSSLATYLLNRLEGRKVVVDLDIGQSSISHPGSMGIGMTEGRILSLSQVKMVDGAFVGTISPTGREVRCLNAVLEIRDKLDRIGWDAVVIDSTGWIKGRKAQEYKLAKARILEPEVIVYFGDEPTFVDVLSVESFKVESFVAKKRSREERIKFRSRKYAEFLENTGEISIDMGGVVSGWKIFKGERIDEESKSLLREILDTEVVYAEKNGDGITIIVTEGFEPGKEIYRAIKEMFGVEDVLISSPDDLKGLVIGLYSDRYLGFGLLKDIHFGSRKITVETSVNVSPDAITRVELGEFRLEDYRECYLRNLWV